MGRLVLTHHSWCSGLMPSGTGDQAPADLGSTGHLVQQFGLRTFSQSCRFPWELSDQSPPLQTRMPAAGVECRGAAGAAARR